MSGQLSKRGRFEALLDEAYWPSFSTSKARSHKQAWDSVHEVFVRELDFSRITFRLNEESDPEEKEKIFAELQLQTRDVLEQCMVSVTGDRGMQVFKVRFLDYRRDRRHIR